MTATIWRVATVRLTPPTATKPANDLRRSRTSSIASDQPPARQAKSGNEPADNAAGKHEQQHQQQTAEHKRPILGIVGDLLVEPNQRQGADRRSPEIIHAPEDGHNNDLGRFRPEHIIGKDTAAKDAVERAGEPGETAGDDKGRELVGAYVQPDKGGALRVVTDRRQHAP